MTSWITSPAVKLDSVSRASVLLLAPAYMTRPSPDAPISDRNTARRGLIMAAASGLRSADARIVGERRFMAAKRRR